MRRYETITILKPTLNEEEIKKVIDRTTGIIGDFDGSIIKLDRWGLKKLAYNIQKEQQGYYLYMQYAGKPEAVSEMERIFRIDDRVMKFLTVKVQDVYSPLPADTAKEEEGPSTEDENIDQETTSEVEEA